MTDRDRIEQITTILCQIKTNGSAYAPNVFDNKSSIGKLHYSSVDIQPLKKLKRNLSLLQELNISQECKKVKGSPKGKRQKIEA
ncbi:hypothetical protein [uncultured Clostridium sp.]|uniref:hypothetical protein n=1 Tax=uncultured Clostridium sp. TaxID=59620 RepID=UPI0025E9599D|nr:hypothetical protein [uncultured Clostridium sp.]